MARGLGMVTNWGPQRRKDRKEESLRKYDALDSFFQDRDVEIDENAEAQIGKTQVAYGLGNMSRDELFDCFQFHDDQIGDD